MISRIRAALLSSVLVSLAMPVFAGEATDIVTRHLYAGTVADGLEALAPLAGEGDAEALFGTGFLTIADTLEAFAQDLYRYGLINPAGGFSPFLIPVPTNPEPEQLTYEQFRQILADVVAGMDEAHDILLASAESGEEFSAPIEFGRITLDLNADGVGDPAESVFGIIGAIGGMEGPPGIECCRPDGQPYTEKDIAKMQDQGIEPPREDSTIGFDRADAIWLAGYTQVVAAQLDLFLAHDFSELYDASFHRLFPQAGLPMEEYSEGGMLFIDSTTDAMIADAIAAIHTMEFPVVEPERLAGIVTRGKTVIALSRQNWEAILAETDDFKELVPSPTQTALDSTTRITEEQVEAWHKTLDVADRILDGELLVPHWRFAQGFDLKAFFETSENTDLVMLLTGQGALPYLRDGPIASAETFAEANAAFGGNLLSFAFWFN